MTEEAIVDCIRLMQAADEILIANGEYRIAAHLSMAIELLLRRVGAGHCVVDTCRSLGC